MATKKRIEVIEALRGLAAFSVAWFHFTNGGGLLQAGWLKSSGAYGWLGVDVFFVISGFIIPYSLYHARYRVAPDAGRFLLKRVIRLDPPYLAALALTILLWYASAATPGFKGSVPDLDPIVLLAHLGYLNAFLGYPWLIPVLWSLAIEFQFYILMSLIFPLVLSASMPVRFSTLACLCALAFAIPNGALMFHYMGLFAFGILTCGKHTGITSLRAYLCLLPLAFGVTVASIGLASAIAGLLACLAIAFVRMPRIAPLAFAGTISYSLYLLHVPVGGRVINLGTRFADNAFLQIGVLTTAFGVTVLASYLMYTLIEARAQRWASRLTYKQSSASASPRSWIAGQP